MKLIQIALAAAALCPLYSFATLGSAPGLNTHEVPLTRSLQQSATRHGDANSKAAAGQVGAASYSVREAVGSDGVTIREYLLPTNVVFAVTWQGPVRPDMSALLGSYFSNFVSSDDGRPRGTGPLIRHNGDFHIESAGHAGFFFGNAYLPRLIPANLNINDLK